MRSERGATTTSVTPRRTPMSSVPSGSAYCSRRTRACSLTSCGSVVGARSGSSRRPNTAITRSVPTTSGTPTSPNSKKPNGRAPASAAASLTMMLTGVPVSASSEPACAEKASGMSICDGGRPARVATTTTTGMSAATAPFTLMSAVTPATRRHTTSSSGVRFVPARPITWRPAHAVTPVASSASLTTNSEAMKITVGSPKPASACPRSRMPVIHSATETPIATMPSGTRFDMNATMASARMTSVVATGSIRSG